MNELYYKRTTPEYINADDLNRIEEWTEFLADYLNSLNYHIRLKTKTWNSSDIPWQHEIDRIRDNINKIHQTYLLLPDFREIVYTNTLNYTQVNVLEWDLNVIYTWLSRMVSMFGYSGEFASAEGGIA